MQTPFNVLFLCTGNSCRSVMAEVALNHLGGGRFSAYSAGSQPKGEVHPRALQVIAAAGMAVDGLRSKSWDEFGRADAPRMDLVVTVCDRAAGETCPYWPGAPLRVARSFVDPADAGGGDAEIAAVFETVFGQIRDWVSALVALPVEALDAAALQARLAALPGPQGS